MKSYRTDIENTFHHITSRGNCKNQIFLHSGDKSKFLKFLELDLKNLDISILAYIIMDNHFHLFIKRKKISVAKFMQRLLTKYAHWYNKKYNKTGHVFERRYYSVLVDSDNYFNNTLVYIHRNICRINHEIKAEDYEWSSYRDILNGNSKIVNINEIIENFNFKKADFIKEFNELHAREFEQDKFIRIRNYNILGNQKFREEWMEKLQFNKRNKIEMDNNRSINYTKVIDFITTKYKIDRKEIMDVNKRNLKIIRIRKKVFFFISKYTRMTNVDIGKLFGLSSNVIGYHIRSFEDERLENEFINFINT